MIVVISPAKSLDFETEPPRLDFTQPALLDDSEKLVRSMRRMSADDLSDLMGIKERLANLNVERFKSWSRPFTEDNAKAAVFAFQGDVYKGLEAEQLKKKELDWTQKHLLQLRCATKAWLKKSILIPHWIQRPMEPWPV